MTEWSWIKKRVILSKKQLPDFVKNYLMSLDKFSKQNYDFLKNKILFSDLSISEKKQALVSLKWLYNLHKSLENKDKELKDYTNDNIHELISDAVWN